MEPYHFLSAERYQLTTGSRSTVQDTDPHITCEVVTGKDKAFKNINNSQLIKY